MDLSDYDEDGEIHRFDINKSNGQAANLYKGIECFANADIECDKARLEAIYFIS